MHHRSDVVLLPGDASRDPHVLQAAPVDLALDLIFGPLFYRLLMGHAPITRGFVDQLIDAVIPVHA
jgi:hypothetical protein